MNKFKVSINKIALKMEPNKKTMDVLESFIAEGSKVINKDNIESFVEQVSSKGYTFCPSTFKNNIKSKETFEQSQLFALYFDSFSSQNNRKISFEKMKFRAEQYNLSILFAYDVFPLGNPFSEVRERFCLVFLNSTPFFKLKEAETIQKALMVIFPEAEKNCSVLKLYKGGNKLLYFDNTIPNIEIDSLFMNMSLYLRDKYGNTNYKRKIVEFSKMTGISLDNKKLPNISIVEDDTEDLIVNINDKNSPFPTIESNYGEKLLHLKYHINFDDENIHKVLPNEKYRSIHRPYRSDTLRYLYSRCNLYQEFTLGKRILTQRELFGLATNLVQIESGVAKFKSILYSESYYNDEIKKYNNWDYFFYYIKNRTPKPCNSFCPYHTSCPHGKNILSTAKLKYHQVEKIANYNDFLVGLEEAWEDFKKNFDEAVTSNEQLWHIIKSQTALGKTQVILELLKDTSLNILVAVPTNRLKQEEYERAKEMGINLIVSPSLHEIKDDLPEDVWEDIQSLYEAGKSPMPYLNKAIFENNTECSELFKKYKKNLIEFKESNSCAITTHRRLANIDVSKYDLVIIDEDIIYSTIIPSRVTIPISELEKLKKKLVANDSLSIKIRKILKKIKKEKFFTVNETKYDESYDDIKTEANISALCSATYFCYRKALEYENDLNEDSISFVQPIKFQQGIKYIMLSATANKNICKYCFGQDNVKFYSCKEAKFAGTLNQYIDKPMSRSFITENLSIIDQIKKWSKAEYTISFKKFSDYYTGDLYFGNCAGCDTLKNKNIDVIGTPHQPEWIYKLFAFSLGFDIDIQLKPNTIVTHNGYRFYFTTYDNEELQTIQFYMIESELEQAIGRARLLRYNCTVNLFSNFPLKQAILKKLEYNIH